MKILQINNTGVVPYTIKEYFRRHLEFGIEMDLVIPMHTPLDRSFQRGLKGVIEIDGNPQILQEFIARNAHVYDVIHLHALYQHLPLIKEVAVNTKVVYTGHGREVRQGWHPSIINLADKVTCVTNDLIVDGVEWIPNVPDPYHFSRKKDMIKGKALIKRFGDPIVDDVRAITNALTTTKRLGLKLDIQDRGKRMYSYINYPRFLEIYEAFFDYKYLKAGIGYEKLDLPLSFTALQFLQLGGTVYHHSGIYDKLPRPHDNYNGVMKRWKEIYEELL